MSIIVRPKWQRVEYDGGSLRYQEYVINLRWPILLQLQLHVSKYGVGDYLAEHIDYIEKGERQFRVQFILKNAVSGGELVVPHFIVNRRHFKIFEPCKYRHAVTVVEEGERLLLNLGIRYSFQRIRPVPF
ncbi:MAG: 2OG-Fe(II) oxygenase [Bacillota bacterium]